MGHQLSDHLIKSVIIDLRRSKQKVTGSKVRNELRRLHGTPGGVSRVYRLLQQTLDTSFQEDSQELSTENASLKHQLVEAIRRAELAEHREEVHQALWAAEIDNLRCQLRTALVDRRVVGQLQDKILELRRKLHQLGDST